MYRISGRIGMWARQGPGAVGAGRGTNAVKIKTEGRAQTGIFCSNDVRCEQCETVSLRIVMFTSSTIAHSEPDSTIQCVSEISSDTDCRLASLLEYACLIYGSSPNSEVPCFSRTKHETKLQINLIDKNLC